MSPLTRRSFVKNAVAAAAPLAFVPLLPSFPVADAHPSVCLFSKPLQGMSWQRLAQAAKKIGFTGIDLTVRPGGHVLPERVTEDLPKAVETIRGEGLDVPMITTELLSARDPAAETTLAAAGRLGIPYCKPGYYKYKFVDVRAELQAVATDFHGLATLAQSKGVRMGFHNHTGYVGGPVWDITEILAGLDPKWAGYYFDPGHAVAEGGGAGWKVALGRIAPNIFMTSIKDFTWERGPQGWREKWGPLGEGMVDWKYYFHELHRAGFHGPVSLHIEYNPGGATLGATPAAKEENMLAAAQRDLEFLWKNMREA
jgi:L-ribulose-5-phosphate 3-epimerase